MRLGTGNGIRTILLAAVLAVTGLTLGASPAGAAEPACPEDSVCVWEGTNFTGRMEVISPVPQLGDCQHLPFAVRSGVNTSDQSVGVERFGCGIISDWVAVLFANSSQADFGGTGSGLSGVG